MWVPVNTYICMYMHAFYNTITYKRTLPEITRDYMYNLLIYLLTLMLDVDTYCLCRVICHQREQSVQEPGLERLYSEALP